MTYTRQSKTFEFEEDPFAKNAQGICMMMHEVLFRMKFLQTKPQNKSKNTNFYDLKHTIIEKLSDEGGEN